MIHYLAQYRDSSDESINGRLFDDFKTAEQWALARGGWVRVISNQFN